MTPDALAAALRDPSEEVRYRALREAQDLDRDPAALALFIEALGDTSWRVRKGAVDRVVGHRDRLASVSGLIATLGNEENAGARNAAAEALVRIGGGAVPGLSEALEAPDRDLRKFAVDILGEIGDRTAVPELVAGLRDPDENVRGAAAEALGKLGGDAAEEALVGVLGSGDLLLGMSALDALGRAGVVVPMDRLRPVLSQRLLRRPMLRLLARTGDDEALELLLEALADPSRGTREAGLAALSEWADWHDPEGARLVEALAALDPDRLRAVAITGIESGDTAVVAGSVLVLSGVGAADQGPAMLAAARDERLRERVHGALLRLGSAAIEPLLRSLDQVGPEGQELAIAVLAASGDRRAVSELVGRLDDAEPTVRVAAVEALGVLGDPRAVEPLARMLGRPDRVLAGTAIRALASLAREARESVLDGCRALLGHEDALRVADACRVLAEVGSPAEIPLLQAVLRHEDARAREAAVDALGLLPDPEAVAHLRYVLADDAPQVRAAAARALGRHGGGSVEALLVALKDDEPSVVGAAAEALGDLGDPSVGRHLLPLLGRPGTPGPAPSAWASVRALARLQASELCEALRRAAAHPEGEVAKEAAAVAGDLPGDEATEVLLGCARHPAWDVRRSAARELARRGDPSVLDALREVLAEEEDALAAEGFAAAIARLEER